MAGEFEPLEVDLDQKDIQWQKMPRISRETRGTGRGGPARGAITPIEDVFEDMQSRRNTEVVRKYAYSPFVQGRRIWCNSRQDPCTLFVYFVEGSCV